MFLEEMVKESRKVSLTPDSDVERLILCVRQVISWGGNRFQQTKILYTLKYKSPCRMSHQRSELQQSTPYSDGTPFILLPPHVFPTDVLRVNSHTKASRLHARSITSLTINIVDRSVVRHVPSFVDLTPCLLCTPS